MYSKSCSKLLLCVSILGLGLFQYLHAQGPDTLWTKTFGGGAGDAGRSVQETTDGGYVIAGRTVSFGAGGADAWLIKTDASGDTLWTKTYGGVDDDYAESVQQTTDGGYILTGMTESFGVGDFDVWLIKTDASGDTLWTKTYGGSYWDYGYSVQQTTDEGFIIAGITRSFGAGGIDVWLIKTDTLGDTLWTKAFGGGDNDLGSSVQQTTDGGFIVAGYTGSLGAGSHDVWLIKTDSLGDTLWTKTFGGSDYDVGSSVQQTTDGGYIVSGRTSSYGSGTASVYLVKTNASGDTLWTKALGGDGYDEALSVQQTTDGGYVMAGFTSSFGVVGHDVLLVKTNDLGDTLWTKTIGGYDYEWGYSVQQTTDGGYIVAGYTGSFGAGVEDVWLIKLGPAGVVEHDQSTIQGMFVQNQPNPFNTLTRILYSTTHSGFVTLSVYDVLGTQVKTLVHGFKRAGEHSVEFDATKLSSGVYYCALKVGDNAVETKKILLLR